MMPQKIICGNCGDVLYEGSELKPPEELIEKLNGKCLKCGKELIFDLNKINITSL